MKSIISCSPGSWALLHFHSHLLFVWWFIYSILCVLWQLKKQSAYVTFLHILLTAWINTWKTEKETKKLPQKWWQAWIGLNTQISKLKYSFSNFLGLFWLIWSWLSVGQLCHCCWLVTAKFIKKKKKGGWTKAASSNHRLQTQAEWMEQKQCSLIVNIFQRLPLY